MPATRGKNLRSGDLAEQLGVLMLQRFALVAPVPRTEDVGVDVVLTLLRDFDSVRVIAEDSAFVQLKASSVTSLVYSAHEVQWLFSLELPLLVGSIDQREGSLKLYCAHALAFARGDHERLDKVELRFDAPRDPMEPHRGGEFCLGPPILQFNLGDTLEFSETFHSVAKAHIVAARRNLEHSRVGWVDVLGWDTNKLPDVLAKRGKIFGETRESQARIEDFLAPYLTSWLQHIVLGGDLGVATSLQSLLAKVIKRGQVHKKGSG
jgi:hypothetical protein